MIFGKFVLIVKHGTLCAFLACKHALFPYLLVIALALFHMLFAFLSLNLVLAVSTLN